MVRKTNLRAWLLALAWAVTGGAAQAMNPGNETSGTTSTGFPKSNDFAAVGPFATTLVSEGPDCEIYRPETLGKQGLRHPVILWGNGTGASPSTYEGLLDHLASHGFVVAAAQTSNAGTGQEMIACLDYLARQNEADWGSYTYLLDIERIATVGHSQGGGGAIMAGTDERVLTTISIQPYIRGLSHIENAQTAQNGPMLLFSGSSDIIASPTKNQRPLYDSANVPVFWATLRGAGHFEPTGDAAGFRGPLTAWLRYYLMDDQMARHVFKGNNCGLCQETTWAVDRRNFD
ncbi:alpha/beta hydrolase [Alkalilimnicola ehrlichii]|uniref:Alpha/beta hydrolase n=1 Tax=Alkalilimnicola ehrlichii TaxID=351052 RepID=A0A3E0X1W6_9GAMM|nr:hypothetical protein [Alkalilimnicola ehrlichii]RFA30597.1 alpha/beta hydrolase [Alkalilimnicola ehrlichii]RFA38147.1 alpha/beta hydrolase [Alkalilimnicola ehrlichii]